MIDDIIINNARILDLGSNLSDKFKKYDYKTMNIHFNYDKNIYTYELNAHIFDDMIDINGHKIKYLIQASKFYDDEVYRYFMYIKGFNENFFYGKIIGIGPLNEYYDENDFKYIPNLILNN